MIFKDLLAINTFLTVDDKTLLHTIAEPARLEPVPRNGRGRDRERPAHCNEERSPHRDEEWPPLAATGESPRTNRRPNAAKDK